jgi:hypothetical protein
MVCLAAAGSFVAGAHYYAVDLPQQMHVQAPANACIPYEENSCAKICAGTYCNYHAPDPMSGGPTGCLDQAAFDTCVATQECYTIIPPC